MGASGGAVAIAGGGASAGSGGGTWCVGAGKAFRPGVTYSAACQTCTCQESGEWSCAGDACPTLECAALLDKYAVELANQRSCDPSLRVEQCQGMATTVLGCDCPTGVNDSATLYSLGQEFAGLGCVRPPCPVCDQVPRSSECVRGEAGDGTCVGFAIR
jgi:hypothetical protein